MKTPASSTKLKWSDYWILLVLGLSVFFHFRGVGRSSQSSFPSRDVLAVLFPGDPDTQTTGTFLLFILDFSDFGCGICFDSFLDFYQRLPSVFKTERSVGLLILRSGREKEHRAKIARKKLRGFTQSNQITIPFQVDRFHVFTDLAEKGTCVVLFDYPREIIKKYTFPLKQKQWEEIFGYLER